MHTLNRPLRLGGFRTIRLYQELSLGGCRIALSLPRLPITWPPSGPKQKASLIGVFGSTAPTPKETEGLGVQLGTDGRGKPCAKDYMQCQHTFKPAQDRQGDQGVSSEYPHLWPHLLKGGELPKSCPTSCLLQCCCQAGPGASLFRTKWSSQYVLSHFPPCKHHIKTGAEKPARTTTVSTSIDVGFSSYEFYSCRFATRDTLDERGCCG